MVERAESTELLSSLIMADRRQRAHTCTKKQPLSLLFQQGLQPLARTTRLGLPSLTSPRRDLPSELYCCSWPRLLYPGTWIVKPIPHSLCGITGFWFWFDLVWIFFASGLFKIFLSGFWQCEQGGLCALHFCLLTWLFVPPGKFLSFSIYSFLTFFWKVLGHDQSSIMFSFLLSFFSSTHSSYG